MATWPANGDTDWNTAMLAYLAVGHDTDGTCKKSQMLTDMGWSPTAMTGANDSTGTVTFPNGLIMKWGKTNRAAATTTVTFDAAFPNACFQAFACGGDATPASEYDTITHTITAASFKIYAVNATNTPLRWFAIGR